MKAHQVDLVASAMLCHLEQIDHAQEARRPRQFRSDVRKADALDRVDLDLAFLHAVSAAHADVGSRPDPHAARDFTSPHPVAKPLCEHHGGSLTPQASPRGILKGMSVLTVEKSRQRCDDTLLHPVQPEARSGIHSAKPPARDDTGEVLSARANDCLAEDRCDENQANRDGV